MQSIFASLLFVAVSSAALASQTMPHSLTNPSPQVIEMVTALDNYERRVCYSDACRQDVESLRALVRSVDPRLDDIAVDEVAGKKSHTEAILAVRMLMQSITMRDKELRSIYGE